MAASQTTSTLSTAARLGASITSFFYRKQGRDEAPPVIHSPRRVPYGPFEFQVELPSGREYEVQVSSDLQHWLALADPQLCPGTDRFLDKTATNQSFRFYRVLSGRLYSERILGYATFIMPPGFSMIACPFITRENSVQSLFPAMPEGATLNKFDTTLFKLNKNEYHQQRWSNPAETLSPGEGAILFNPMQEFIPVHLVGEVPQGDLSYPLPPGFSIRSSMLPLPGRIDADLSFPATNGDAIHLFDRDRQKYLIYTFESGKWLPETPLLGVAESFWVGKTDAGNWLQMLETARAVEQDLDAPSSSSGLAQAGEVVPLQGIEP